MPGGTGRQHAVHHVDAQTGVFDDLFRRAHSHQVAWHVFREMLQSGFDDLTGQFTGFADAEPSYGIAWEADFDSAFGGLFTEAPVHPALQDAEEGLGGTCSFEVSSFRFRASGVTARNLKLETRNRIPRHFLLMIFKILLAPRCPARR